MCTGRCSGESAKDSYSLESFITELTSVIFESWVFDSSKLLSNLYAMSSTDLVRGDSVAGNADLEIREFSSLPFVSCTDYWK